jgi:hypothetical protein
MYITCLVYLFHNLGIPHDVLVRASMIVGLIQDGKPIYRISTDKVERKEMCYKVCCPRICCHLLMYNHHAKTCVCLLKDVNLTAGTY